MAERSYGQACPLARALDVLGERWTLLVVRELGGGPRRFGELLEGLPGMSTNLLAMRLQRLSDAGLAERAPDGRAWRLTERGAALRPVLAELARWGIETLGVDEAFLSGFRPRVLVSAIALTAPLDGEDVSSLPGPLELSCEGEVVTLLPGADGVLVEEGAAAGGARLGVTTDRGTLLLLMGGHVTVAAAVDSGALALDGAREDLEAWIAALRLDVPLRAG